MNKTPNWVKADGAKPGRAKQDGATAAGLGAELRERRQSLGWELPQLADSLRIRQTYLEAIEAGRIGDMPGTTYALGFVRAYAGALGLNGEQIASRFRTESAEASVRPALSFPAPVPQRGVPAGALMLLGLLILAGAYSGWYYFSERQRTPAETVQPIPDHLLPHVAEPSAPSPQIASILPTASPPVHADVLPTPSPAKPTAAAPAPSPAPSSSTLPSLPSLPVAPPAQLSAVPETPAPGSLVQAPPAQTAAAPAPATRIVLKTTADAWVTVKQPSGPAVFNRMMHAGDIWPVPATPAGLLLTTGNAGGTTLEVDGTPVVALGGSGAVRRDLPLDADMLKSGHLPPSGHARQRPAPATPATH